MTENNTIVVSFNNYSAVLNYDDEMDMYVGHFYVAEGHKVTLVAGDKEEAQDLIKEAVLSLCEKPLAPEEDKEFIKFVPYRGVNLYVYRLPDNTYYINFKLVYDNLEEPEEYQGIVDTVESGVQSFQSFVDLFLQLSSEKD